MAVSENDTSDCNSDSSLDGMSKERKEKPITKVIIRRLPPSMTKDTFLEQVSPLPDYDYMYFVKADLSMGEYAFSRAYINFKNSSDIFIFKERFDNYVFLDQKGNEYAAVVEFAPFSRIAKRRNKGRIDPKCGSIETDPIYTTFVESLNKQDEDVEEKPEYNVQPTLDEDKQKITNTPLLDFIKQRRIDRQKIREEKREERKRREVERKRYKDDERKRKTKPEPYPSKHGAKNIHILNTTKEEQGDEKREEKHFREKKFENKYDDRKYEDKKYEERKYGDRKYEDSKYDDRKYDDRKYEEKKYGDKKYEDKYERKPYKDDRKYTSYFKSKEVRKSDEYYKKPPPPKIKLRFEKTDSKTKPPFKREDTYNKKNETTKTVEEEKTEKKVKKYSERREEHKNEIKKLETLKKEENKDSQSDAKHENIEHKKNENFEDKNNDQNESKENDPRSQRRIKNKDRPAMPIYQPGMGFRRNKGDKTDTDKPKTEQIEKSKSETTETEVN